MQSTGDGSELPHGGPTDSRMRGEPRGFLQQRREVREGLPRNGGMYAFNDTVGANMSKQEKTGGEINPQTFSAEGV